MRKEKSDPCTLDISLLRDRNGKKITIETARWYIKVSPFLIFLR